MVGSRNLISEILRYIILSAVFVIMVFPLVWMFRVSLMQAGASISLASVLERGYTIQNFIDLFTSINIGRNLFNSAFVN